MPNLPKRPCGHKPCPRLVEPPQRLCPEHRKAFHQSDAGERGNANARGYTAQWNRATKAFLREHPICADPYGIHGQRFQPATCTDHIHAHKGDHDLFWDPDNWQPLCLVCNRLKAIREEGALKRG